MAKQKVDTDKTPPAVQTPPNEAVNDKQAVLKYTLDDRRIYLGLSNGLSLTETCEQAGEDIRGVSTDLITNETFMKECEKSILSYATRMNRMANEALSGNKMAEYASALEGMKRTPKLVWWKKDSDGAITNKKIVDTFLKYKNKFDTATSLGMSWGEYTSHIAANEVIATMLTKFNQKDFV